VDHSAVVVIKEIYNGITLVLLLLIKEISEWITLQLLLIKKISEWITLQLLLIKEISKRITLMLLLITNISVGVPAAVVTSKET